MLVLAVALCPAIAAGHDVTINGNVQFSELDGSPLDHDGVVDGVFTVTDGNLRVVGTISCNDAEPLPQTADACRIQINVSGNIVIATGSAILAENSRGKGNGGDITLTAGGHLILEAVGSVLPGGLISSSRTGGPDSATDRAGTIRIRTGGDVNVARGATIAANAAAALGGEIEIVADGAVIVDGLVASGPSSRLRFDPHTGRALIQSSAAQSGGPITIQSFCLTDPGVIIGGEGVVVSQGELTAARVQLDACGIDVRGLVASLSKDAGSSVALRSATTIRVDGSDLGDAAAIQQRFGQVRADGTIGGGATNEARLLAANDITVLGPIATEITIPAVSAMPGNANGSPGGIIRVVSLQGQIVGTGRAFQAGRRVTSNDGGTIALDARQGVTLDGARLFAFGDPEALTGKGGSILVRSYQGSVRWESGTGDVRPTGAGVPRTRRGVIALTYCTSVTTVGTNFPAIAGVVPPFPEILQNCADAAPTLPPGETLADAPPTVTLTTPGDGAIGVSRDTTIRIEFSEAVSVSAAAFVLRCPNTGSPRAFSTAQPSGSVVVLTPSGPLPVDSVCQVTVVATNVRDVDTEDGPDRMSQDYVFSFSTGPGSPATIVSSPAATFVVATSGVFQILTTGFPTPQLSKAGALPAGVSFQDNGDGTATLAGIPGAGTAGFFGLTVTASNSSGPPALQNFTLTVQQAPSLASTTPVTFTVGSTSSIAVTATGWPTPAITSTGLLPSGLTFVDHGNGTGTLSGTPASGTAGAYNPVLTAANAVGSLDLAMTVLVKDPPAASSTTSSSSSTSTPTTVATFGGGGGVGFMPFSAGSGRSGSGTSSTPDRGDSGGSAGSFGSGETGGGDTRSTVESAGLPRESSPQAPPRGRDATGASAGGGRPDPSVPAPPEFATRNREAFTVEEYANFTVMTVGSPAPRITRQGALPPGLSMTDNRNGTATIFGIPEADSFGVHKLTLIAANSLGAARQELTLAVCPALVLAPRDPLRDGQVGKRYAMAFVASGGTGPYTFKLAEGSPTGWQMEGPSFFGTPTMTGYVTFTVIVTDATGCQDLRTYRVLIGSDSVVAEAPAASTGATAGAPPPGR